MAKKTKDGAEAREPGTGQIKPRLDKNGKPIKDVWRVLVFMGRDAAGKRQYASATVHGSKRDAQKKLTEMQGDQNKGTLVAPHRQTLSAYLTRWVDTYVKPPKRRERTYRDYLYRIKTYIVPNLGARRLDQLTATEVQELYNRMERPKAQGGMGLSPRSVLYVHQILSSALRRAVKTRVLAHNPLEGTEPPTVTQRKASTLKVDQRDRFLAVARERGDRWYALWMLFFDTGFRPSEALALRWSDLRGNVLRVERALVRANRPTGDDNKTPLDPSAPTWWFDDCKTDQSQRAVTLTPEMVEALEEHREHQKLDRKLAGDAWEDHGLIFAGPRHGRPLDISNVTKRHFRPILKAAGLPTIRLYETRHTHATELKAAGLDTYRISRRLGHAKQSTTEKVYIHLFDDVDVESTDEMSSYREKKRREATG